MRKSVPRHIVIALSAATLLALPVWGPMAAHASADTHSAVACDQRGAGHEHQSIRERVAAAGAVGNSNGIVGLFN